MNMKFYTKLINYTIAFLLLIPFLLSYPGWYSQPGDVSDASRAWNASANWVLANHPDKPFTVSETGGGGIYEWVNSTAHLFLVFFGQQLIK